MMYNILTSKWIDWLVNFLGVLAGSFFAWLVAFWQVRRQSKEQDLRDRGLLLAYLDRLKIELRNNAQVAGQLIQIMESSPQGRVDLFEWAGVVAQSLSSDVYRDFVSSGLQRQLKRSEESDIHSAYGMVMGLRSMATQSLPAARFHFGYHASQEDVNQLQRNLAVCGRTTQDHVNPVRDLVYRTAAYHRSQLGLPRTNEDPKNTGADLQ